MYGLGTVQIMLHLFFNPGKDFPLWNDTMTITRMPLAQFGLLEVESCSEKTKFRNSAKFPTKIFVEKTKFCNLLSQPLGQNCPIKSAWDNFVHGEVYEDILVLGDVGLRLTGCLACILPHKPAITNVYICGLYNGSDLPPVSLKK